MKLYATITSERASKGQGGKYLNIKITNEKKETIALMWFEEKEAIISTREDISVEVRDLGKNQKGETREGVCHCGYPCDYGTDYCNRHQIP